MTRRFVSLIPTAALVALALAWLQPPAAAQSASAASFGRALYMAEYFTTGDGDQVGRVVFFNDRGNKQLSADFAPGLALDGTDAISYYIDDSRPTGDVDLATSSAAIDRAMATWDGVTCSQLGMVKQPFTGQSGFVSALFGFGGSFDYFADVVHAGWLPGGFFDLLAPGGSDFILGVTFTIIFTDANGDPVDTNGDRKADVAWREIYYNDAFTWQDGARFDIETVALHEAGHGLSQAHFGTAFRTASNGRLHFAPRAVMNAAYSGRQTTIDQTDLAGHCSNWANWPNR